MRARLTHVPGAASKLVLPAGALLAAYALVIRPWHRRWGATDAEVERAMPGDELVPNPNYWTNRAVTIHARPAGIWPWLVQMGEAPRAGFYSYTLVERALGMHVVNADRLLPGHEHLAVGDALDRTGNLVVKAIAHDQYLVLGPPADAPWGTSTWSIALYPLDEERTRLVSRVRARIDHWTPQMLGWALLLDPGQFVMERKWLLGLKQRAENAAGHGPPSGVAPPLPFPA
ncbi:MAG TPA: hypothetical protein VK066_04335 [Chloroflexota bacterium]|nr:hypothetical protein [Chloroflexota bacterium]